MDLIDGMRTFISIVECGSFKGAGDRLGLTNKLVSKYLATLETRVGEKLLHRTTRSLSLTEAGEIYLEGCRKILEVNDAVQIRLKAPSERLIGKLRVAVPASFGESFVSDATRLFLSEHPSLTVDLHMSDSQVDLAAGGFDLAIRIGNLRDSALVARKIGQTSRLVVASPNYLGRFGVPLHPDDLASHSCIRDTNDSDPNSWPFEIKGTLQRVPIMGRFSVNSATTCLQFARAGFGLVQCPDIFLMDDLKSGTLVPVLCGFPSGSISIQMVHLPTSFRPQKVTAFMEFLQALFLENFRPKVSTQSSITT